MQQMQSRSCEQLPFVPTPCAPPEDVQMAGWRRLRHDLRQAVRDRAFVLGFQSRRRLLDNSPCGADTQVRWQNRGRGVVQASTFMPLVEECGLTGQVLSWTLLAACTAALAWKSGVVSVTVPAQAVRDGVLIAMVGEALAATGMDPGRLEVAVADSAVPGDCAETMLALSALRDRGLGVALDDFGRDTACLLKLKRLPLTAVKLDRSLVRDMLCDRAAASMIRAAIDFAHTLEVQVVASGVETDAQRAFLRHVGCDAVLERGAVPPERAHTRG